MKVLITGFEPNDDGLNASPCASDFHEIASARFGIPLTTTCSFKFKLPVVDKLFLSALYKNRLSKCRMIAGR